MTPAAVTPRTTSPAGPRNSVNRRFTRSSELSSAGWPAGYAARFFQVKASARMNSLTWTTAAVEDIAVLYFRDWSERRAWHGVSATVRHSRYVVQEKSMNR